MLSITQPSNNQKIVISEKVCGLGFDPMLYHQHSFPFGMISSRVYHAV